MQLGQRAVPYTDLVCIADPRNLSRTAVLSLFQVDRTSAGLRVTSMTMMIAAVVVGRRRRVYDQGSDPCSDPRS